VVEIDSDRMTERQSECAVKVYFLLSAASFGGVTGRPEFKPEYWYFAFFSEGFKIWKISKHGKHVKLKSSIFTNLNSKTRNSLI